MANWGKDSKATWDQSWGKGAEGAAKGQAISGSINAIGGAITDIAGAAIENAKIADTTNEENQIKDTAATQFSTDDYDSLQSEFNMNDLTKSDYSGSDVRGGSTGQRILNTGKAAISGASAGAQVGGPWGAVIGAAVGLAGGIGGWVTGDIKAKNKALELNTQAKLANNRYLNNFANSASTVGNKMFNSAALNLAAFGGMLKSNTVDNFTKYKVRVRAFGGQMMTPSDSDDFTNGVITVGEGGSHEENPYGGVLMGVDNEGVPNLVEEGEVIFNDYVFSKRNKITKKQLKSVNLPEKFEDMSAAEVAKKLQEESEERPNDPISRNGLVDSMMKLTTIQEEIRQRDRENLRKRVFAFGGNKMDGTDSTQTLSGKPTWMSDELWSERQQLMSDIQGLDMNPKGSQSSSSWAGAAQTWARYAPLVGSGLQALSDAFGWTNKEDYGNATLIRNAARRLRTVNSRPVSGYISFNPYDTNYEQTLLRNQALSTQRGILDTTGGNRGAARNALMAFNYNVGTQMGDLYKKAAEYNENQRRAVAQFNLGINQFNSQQGFQVDQANLGRDQAVLDAAYREALLRDQIETATSSAKSANITNFWNNLGALGKEAGYRQTAQGMADTGVYGAGAGDYNKRVGLAKGGQLRKRRKEFNI